MAFLNESVLTTDFVLCEFVNFVSKSNDRPRAVTVIDWLRNDPSATILEATRFWFDAGFALHSQRGDKEWSLTDCISFEAMNSARITRALTHDCHFEQAGYKALLRRDPPES
jgi:hypothetical protein